MNDSKLLHFSLNSELIQDIMNDLMNTSLLSEKSLNYLKGDNVETIEPVLKMNLRHEQVKQTYEQKHNHYYLIKEARRLVEEEEGAEKEKLKEIRMVNREIQKFQKQLQEEHKKLVGDQKFPEKKLWTQNGTFIKTPIIAIRTTKKKSNNLQDMKNTNFYHDQFLDIQSLKVEEIYKGKTENIEEENFFDEQKKKLKNDGEDPKTQEESVFSKEESKTIYDAQNEKKKYQRSENSEYLKDLELQTMNKVWIKWMKYVQHKKKNATKNVEINFIESKRKVNDQVTPSISYSDENNLSYTDLKTEENHDFTDEHYENYENRANEYYLKHNQIQKNFLILRKYFLKWKTWVIQIKERKTLLLERQKREEKIKKYIELIKNKKESIIDFNSKGKPNDSSSTQMNYSSKNYSKETKTTIKDLNYNATFKHRFEAQKNIIAKQKSKIEDQNKIIEDLKSFQQRLETEMSRREMNKNLKETLQNFDPRLKCKAAQVQRALSSDSGYKSSERASSQNSETSEDTNCSNLSKAQTLSAEIVRRMEKRNEERKLKMKAAQERKKQIEEEREMKMKEEEEMRQRQELEAKKRKLEELKEKQRLEVQKEEQRLIERENFKLNCKIADESNRRRLLSKTLKSLKYNVLNTKRDAIIAEGHYITKLKKKFFFNWKCKVQEIMKQKVQLADKFHTYCLLRTAFKRLLQVYKEFLQKLQAADDMYDMKIQHKYFNKWHGFVCTIYLETQDNMKIAANFHNRRMVRNHFNQWRRLPKIMFHEREREHRLRILRERVQELLPDYQPVPYEDDN